MCFAKHMFMMIINSPVTCILWSLTCLCFNYHTCCNNCLFDFRSVSCKRCLQVIPTRKRSASTSSQAQLTQDDATFVAPSGPRQERELFSIADQDGGDDGRPPQRGRRSTEDDYFYDEIFERSAFVDESTNRANKHLTIEQDDDDEELGNMNVPDLVFKKPNSRF